MLESGRSALLVDFFDPNAQVDALNQLLDNASLRQDLSAEAKKMSQQYASTNGLLGWGGVLGLELNT